MADEEAQTFTIAGPGLSGAVPAGMTELKSRCTGFTDREP
jgi:hypothetical protein